MKDPVIVEARTMLVKYLKEQAQAKGLSTYRLAEMTGMDQPNVYRILNGKYSPTLDTFMALARAVDCYVFIIDKDSNEDIVNAMNSRWHRGSEEQ